MTNERSVEMDTAPLDRNRSLVFVERRQKPRVLPRAAADFLAQLIASNRRLGEFRRAMRRDASIGIGEYTASEPRLTPGFERRI